MMLPWLVASLALFSTGAAPYVASSPIPTDYPVAIAAAAAPSNAQQRGNNASVVVTPGTKLGKTFRPGAQCWVLTQELPTRSCTLTQNDCQIANISEADSCTRCSRGWGVYGSQQECLKPLVGASSDSVDPSTYPSPYVPGNWCPSRRLPNWGKSYLDPCPHNWPDLRLWEDPNTWPSMSVPSAGSSVTLPSNTRVLITGCSFTNSANSFASITIPKGSELVLDDAQIHLRVGRIIVAGNMRVGSAQCRTTQRITISLVGAPGIASSDMALKVTGELDLHGYYFSPTWTRLASTAAAGQNWVTLQDVVNWWPGQLVAIPTSIFRDEYSNQNEVMQIQSVKPDGKTLVFTSPLKFYHYGGAEYQTEVVLLSRTILIQGPASADATLTGGHVHISGKGRIEGSMAYRMGQRNVLGSYPWHFHLLGEVQGDSYIKDSSVYHSFFRGVTVHGTNNLLVKDNTAFHVDGNCFYLEDGVEERNWFEHNFAGFVHVLGTPASGPTQAGMLVVQRSDLIQPADSAAAGFYASNPNNAFVNNAASGGFAGFAFPTLPKPVGRRDLVQKLGYIVLNGLCDLPTVQAQMFRQQANFVPLQRPLGQFSGNTAHSTGYYWIMAGGIYFGGRLWNNDQDGGKLYYSSGRWEHDPRDSTGQQAFHVLTNNKVWLAQWGISHWGQRIKVIGWEAHDCTRGANVFGVAQISNAVINGRSNNAWAKYPGTLTDIDPIAGFRWYDTRVMTILSNITFMNYKYQPELGTVRQGVWYSMPQSDEYKPAHISTSNNIKYINVDWPALVHNEVMDTGASRYFNWLDWDGSASQRFRPTLFASWPSWWNLGSDCFFKSEWNNWVCDWYPWRTVGRLDVRVPGYTAQVDTNSAYDPTPANYMGYVAQFGYKGSSNRSMIITRNEGITGVTGTGGWYVHLNEGVTPVMRVFLTQVPRGTSILFATRYPAGTAFTIARNFQWYGQYSSPLRQAGSLSEVLSNPSGELYWFNGKHLYIKLTDPGDGSVDPNFMVDGAPVWGTRYFSMSYDIQATNLQNCYSKNGGTFCSMQADPNTDIPDAAPSYNSWSEPYCVDVPPPTSFSCAQHQAWGQCEESWMRQPSDVHAAAIGGYCAVTCGKCKQWDYTCVDRPVPGGLSGGASCAQLGKLGACYQSWMSAGNFCGATCGQCNGKGVPCVDVQPSDGSTCAQRLAWGNCNASWMVSYNYCRATCKACTPDTPPGCTDNPTPDGFTCAQQLSWGKCSETWFQAGGYCAATCGRCSGSSPAPAPTPVPPPAPTCTDVAPPGGYTCQQQAGWGKCSADFMIQGNYCAATCGRCSSSPCSDVQPPGGYTCQQQASWGKCSADFMTQGNYCAATCGRCSTSSSSSTCDDVQPPGGYTCQQQVGWGKCGADFMTQGNYCRRTCGLCTGSVTVTLPFNTSTPPSPTPVPILTPTPVPTPAPTADIPIPLDLPPEYFLPSSPYGYRSSAFISAQVLVTNFTWPGSQTPIPTLLPSAQDAVIIANETLFAGPSGLMPVVPGLDSTVTKAGLTVTIGLPADALEATLPTPPHSTPTPRTSVGSPLSPNLVKAMKLLGRSKPVGLGAAQAAAANQDVMQIKPDKKPLPEGVPVLQPLNLLDPVFLSGNKTCEGVEGYSAACINMAYLQGHTVPRDWPHKT